MAWPRNDWIAGQALAASDLNAHANAFRTWGDAVNAGGYNLSNLGDLSLAAGKAISAPGQPRSKARKAAAQTILNNTNTMLTFDTNEFDVGGIHSVSVNPTRFTVQTSQGGLYLAIGQVSWNSGLPGACQLVAYLNGAAPNGTGVIRLTPTAPTATEIQVVSLLTLVPGDYIEFGVAQYSGGSINTYPEFTFGSIAKLA